MIFSVRYGPVALAALAIVCGLPSIGRSVMPRDSETLRVATFNVSLYGKKAGEIRERLSGTDDLQAKRIASIVQTVRPDILLINELDHSPDNAIAELLARNYFSIGQDAVTESDSDDASPTDRKLRPIEYPFVYSAPSNTGVDSGLDLNSDGKTGTPNDAWGYGVYPGQYAMTLFSRVAIDFDHIRTFQTFRWCELPGALRPVDPKTGTPYYNDKVWHTLRLSSKNHIDVPVKVAGATLHVLACHPTPPVFDGPEDHNGCRNHDEIEFWNHYVGGGANGFLVDDQGNKGGLSPGSRFVLLGDLNSDPVDGSGRPEAIRRLLANVTSVNPVSKGAETSDPNNLARHSGNPAMDTADFGRNGNMRVDFVLPGKENITLEGSGVFWPPKHDPQSRWLRASDHRLVWVDIRVWGEP